MTAGRNILKKIVKKYIMVSLLKEMVEIFFSPLHLFLKSRTKILEKVKIVDSPQDYMMILFSLLLLSHLFV